MSWPPEKLTRRLSDSDSASTGAPSTDVLADLLDTWLLRSCTAGPSWERRGEPVADDDVAHIVGVGRGAPISGLTASTIPSYSPRAIANTTRSAGRLSVWIEPGARAWKWRREGGGTRGDAEDGYAGVGGEIVAVVQLGWPGLGRRGTDDHAVHGEPPVLDGPDGQVAVVEGAQAGPGDDDPGDGQASLAYLAGMSSRLNAWPRLTVTPPALRRARCRGWPLPRGPGRAGRPGGSSTLATSAARSGAEGVGEPAPFAGIDRAGQARTSSTSPGSPGRTPVWAGLTTATFFRRARRMAASAAVTTVLPTPVSVPVTKQTVMGRSRALPGAAP